MSVTLFPGALAALLESEHGPVGLFVHRKTDDERDKVAKAGGDYYGSAPDLSTDIENDVSVQMEGSTGIILITPGKTGHKWSRLIGKARNGSWLNKPEVMNQV